MAPVEVEVLVNPESRVSITIDAMSAAPVCYKLIDHESMILELVYDDGSRRQIAFPADARDGWQKLVDTGALLVIELDNAALEMRRGLAGHLQEQIAQLNSFAKQSPALEDLRAAIANLAFESDQIGDDLPDGITRDEWLEPEIVD